jgi:YfiH family protein
MLAMRRNPGPPTVTALVPTRRGDLDLFTFPSLVPGLDLLVTSRRGGVSIPPFHSLNLGDHVGDNPDAVAQNRRRVAEAIGVAPHSLVHVSQQHGADVVDGDRTSLGAKGDAIALARPDRAAMILVADCLPIALVDPKRRQLALVHAGWKGLEAGVVHAAVSALVRRPDRLVAYVGPGISAAAYQVGPEVAERFADVEGALQPDTGDKSRLDLRAVLIHQLAALGVPNASITLSAQSTDGGTTFYSDRARRPTGRFAMIARWAVS